MEHVKEKGILEETEFIASFCGERCEKGPVLAINGKTIEGCTLEKAVAEIERQNVS
jgi:NADH-quinone oxidoreductase subunit G